MPWSAEKLPGCGSPLRRLEACPDHASRQGAVARAAQGRGGEPDRAHPGDERAPPQDREVSQGEGLGGPQTVSSRGPARGGIEARFSTIEEELVNLGALVSCGKPANSPNL